LRFCDDDLGYFSVSEKSWTKSADSLIGQVANPKEWTDKVVDAALPVLAVSMAEVAVGHLMAQGIDIRQKSVKHLPGQHDQSTHGHGMSYTMRDAEGKLRLADGSPLPDHIPKNIPPAWKEVMVADEPDADLLVTGLDSKGRKQAVYSESHKIRQAALKFAKVNELRQKTTQIAKEIRSEMKGPTKEEATCLLLIQKTGIRPGSEKDTLASTKAYGATTLLGRHVVEEAGGGVRLKFTGKKGVELDIEVKEPGLRTELLRRRKRVGEDGKLFDTTDSRLRSYAKSKNGGGFNPKDFRTAKGTSEAVLKMKTLPKPKSQKEYKKAVREVAKHVSSVLGNTPTIALQSYIDPSVFSKWRVK